MAIESNRSLTSDLQGYGTHTPVERVPRRAKPTAEELHLRQPEQHQVSGAEITPMRQIALAFLHLRNEVSNAVKMLEDRSRPVDEYTPQTLVTEAETQITVQPNWDMGEVITSCVITGPTGAVTLQLGDRTWNLTIPATGVIVIAPMALRISRSDNRILTAGTPGNYSVELMGYADVRTGK